MAGLSIAEFYRAYLLKEQLRQIFLLPLGLAIAMLDDWLIWARRCRLRPFVKLAKNVRVYGICQPL